MIVKGRFNIYEDTNHTKYIKKMYIEIMTGN